MNQLEQTKIALLREASNTLNTISKVKRDGLEFVKCKRAFDRPEETRTLYLLALNALVEEGATELVLTNEYLDLFELKQPIQISTLAGAKDALLRQLNQDGRIYKIHSVVSVWAAQYQIDLSQCCTICRPIFRLAVIHRDQLSRPSQSHHRHNANKEFRPALEPNRPIRVYEKPCIPSKLKLRQRVAA